LRRLLLAALATLSLAATLSLPVSAAAARPAQPTRVAIIVGPVGSLTPTYLYLAELAGAEAERQGAVVARAYSPNATPANVLAAVDGAHVVIYFGHGYGHPSPYGGLNTAKQNGWALQGPRAHGTHGDSLNGEIAYYGEDWIVANARPAPGFVMIYSNVCYAPGASEGGHPAASEATALQRVAHYSRKVFRMGGSAYYAVDFDRGAADLVGRLLANRQTTYGTLFSTDPRYVPSALRGYFHPFSAGRQVWLHRTKYTDGPPNYWYAFAGEPNAVPARSWDSTAPTAKLVTRPSNLHPAASLRVAFSEPVRGVSGQTLRLIGPGDKPLRARVRIDVAKSEAVLRPERPLALSTRYRLELAGGVTDAVGNPAAATTWELAVRLDADPLEDLLPIVLEPGAHKLVRVDALGRITERRSIDIADPRWLSATRRVRLPGRAGSWLEFGGTSRLAGWWVGESGSAHAAGIIDVARYRRDTEIQLDGGRYPRFGVSDGTARPEGTLAIRSERNVAIDRRLVADGLLLVRVAADVAEIGGSWIRIEPSNAPPESAAVRLLDLESRDGRTSLALGLGDWTAVRVDHAGRVIDRREVSGGPATRLKTDATVSIGGASFHVLSGGELDGWAIRDDARHTVRPIEEAADSVD
jgi:hypothetical protein